MSSVTSRPKRPPARYTQPVELPPDEFIAWDIETCPLHVKDMSEAQLDRLRKQLHYQRERDPDLDEQALERKVCSLHPELSFVCCISAVRASKDGNVREPRSWTAATPAEEKELLRGFLTAVGKLVYGTQWVTFNGKRFDVPYLKARIAHHRLGGLVPRNGIFDTYPYKHEPHADLCGLWRMPCTLKGLCDLLGVESSKTGMTGADVAPAVWDGRIDDVRTYCEADVIATAKCLQVMADLIKV